jgi:hypothetical protein
MSRDIRSVVIGLLGFFRFDAKETHHSRQIPHHHHANPMT